VVVIVLVVVLVLGGTSTGVAPNVCIS
jgi:hypothetical protein